MHCFLVVQRAGSCLQNPNWRRKHIATSASDLLATSLRCLSLKQIPEQGSVTFARAGCQLYFGLTGVCHFVLMYYLVSKSRELNTRCISGGDCSSV
jgi:hypothetical protein